MVDFNGNGSYDQAIAAVHHYKMTYKKMPGVKMTLAPENIKYTYEAVLNLLHEGYKEIYLTDEEMAVYKAIKQNNKGSMRFIFTDGEKNNL